MLKKTLFVRPLKNMFSINNFTNYMTNIPFHLLSVSLPGSPNHVITALDMKPKTGPYSAFGGYLPASHVEGLASIPDKSLQ